MPSMHDRAFQWLIRLLPEEFRDEYSREMETMFRATRRDARGRWELLRLWGATVADVVRTAPSQHLDILRRDLVYAFRMLGRRPALTLTATLTLALGTGGNTAIFSVVDGVLFAPLPYPDPERLVLVQEAGSEQPPASTGYFSFDTLRSEHQTFERVAAMSGWSAVLSGDGKDAERVGGARVTWDFFRTLGIAPALGRDFDQSEDHPERRRVALLSNELWRRRFGADPRIVGTPVTINQVTYTVAGVMPASLTELVTARRFAGTEIWTLLGYAITQPQACRSCRHIQVVGRLRPGIGVEQAAADLTRIYQSLGQRFPTDYSAPRAELTPVREFFLGPARQPLMILWGAVGVLLLMACANIANLLLIRASEREEEIAIRRALGVSPARMLRQLLTEALVLAAAGGVAGILLAQWGTSLLTTSGPDAIPRLDEVAVNGRVLVYALGLTIVTGVLFGLAPARLLIGRTGETSTRRDGSRIVPDGRRSTAGPGAWRYRAGLIAANVALSAVLLAGSGLLVRSFLRLLDVEPGFDPKGLLTLQMTVSGPAYSTVPGVNRFYEELIQRLARLPGVTSASVATQIPLTGSVDMSGITIEGRELPNPADAPEADRYAVRADYFATMGIPLLRGRVFTDADGFGALPVAIVGKTMAETLWPGEDPIGRRIRIAGGDGNPMRTIVGVVGDVRHYGLQLPATLQVYMPHAQAFYPEPMTIVLMKIAAGRSPVSLADHARAEIRGIDPLQPVTEIRSYETIVAESVATRRFTLVLLAAFAATALVLALVGLYGALSYVVSQRQKEIGVRVALGALAADIRWLVVRQGMVPVAAGLAAGLAISLAAGRAVETLLYGITARDLVTFVLVLVVVGAGGFAACVLPARRAARIEPAATLRAQ